MTENMYFDQCMDFLARMIEKYGDKIDLTGENEKVQQETNDCIQPEAA